MIRRLSLFIAAGLLITGIYTSCKHEPGITPKPENPDTAMGNFPDAVGKIFVTRCATAGCHNATSYTGAGGLLLDSWEHLFEGGNNGAVIVPYSVDNSSLLYYINTFPELGPTATPTMPVNGTPLTKEEYMTIHDWVANGAPNRDGTVPFSSDPDTRQKIYLTQQGCDLVAVIDAEKQVVMRYIPIGTKPGIEAPHCIRFDAAGQYAYVSFLGSNYVQKIDARTDKLVDSVDVGSGSWNILQVPPSAAVDKVIVADFDNELFAWVNTSTMTKEYDIPFSGTSGISGLHGIATNQTFDTFYTTMQLGNSMLKFWLTPTFGYKRFSIDGNPPVAISGPNTPDPHEIMMNPARTMYFLSCEKSNEVRVMDARADTLIKVIPVGIKPQELAMSRTKPYLLVSCMEDDNQLSAMYKGSVYVINYETLQIVKKIHGKFYQPHGVTVDDRNGKIYIASRNANPNGPAPHHASSCTGRNGWYNVYDLNTLEPATGKRFEVTVEPYFADTRFK